MSPSGLKKFEAAREKEWQPISVDKQGVVRVLTLEESREVLQRCPKLIADSRYVYTRKDLELVTLSDERLAKARWTVKGYQSPYLEEEFKENVLTAPTLTQVGKMCVIQTIVSFKLELEPGGITGAFLESDDMQRELYVRQPPEGLPGLVTGQLV